jgi:hypothetical protein
MLAPITSGTGCGFWPTPTATLVSHGGLVTPAKSAEGGTLIEALSARTVWMTPNSRDWKDSGPTQGNRHSPNLGTQAGGQLNPMWVEWLMGWPLGWTDLKPLETDKFRSAPQQHGACLEAR